MLFRCLAEELHDYIRRAASIDDVTSVARRSESEQIFFSDLPIEARVRREAFTFSSFAFAVVPPVRGYILAPAMNSSSRRERTSLASVPIPFNVHEAGKK